MQEYKILKDIKITRNAKKRIDEIKAENENVFIRIMITRGGCAGYQYYILMDDYIGETDFVLIRKKNRKELIYIVIDEVSLEHLHNSIIDFNDTLEFSGFMIKNPNAKLICNCGNSFNCNEGAICDQKNCINKNQSNY